MTVVAYTDASHCPNTKYAACGFVVLVGGKVIKHQVILVENMPTSQQAETHAAVEALQHCFMLKNVSTIHLYTDLEATIKRRKDDKKQKYPELYDTIEMVKEYGVGLHIHYVRGHSGDQFNSMIDKSCRKQLQRLLKSQNGTNA